MLGRVYVTPRGVRRVLAAASFGGADAQRGFGVFAPDPESMMLGPPKPRRLDEPIRVSLDDLVPPDHFYRHSAYQSAYGANEARHRMHAMTASARHKRLAEIERSR